MQRRSQSFTLAHNGLARVLQTAVHVAPAFDPKSTPQPLTPQTCGAKEFVAIWDTGATGTAITEKVVQECGLSPIGMARIHTVNGPIDTPTFFLSIFLPNHVFIPQVLAAQGMISSSDVLIGMDIISQGDFAITNTDGKTVFSFRMPSIRKIDFVKEANFSASVPRPAQPHQKVGRNDPCPCGSGKKYKKCCGRNTV